MSIMRKPRNHKREYERRITRGLALGKSRAAARGHPKASDLPKPRSNSIDRSDPIERALRLMRRGVNQRTAAKVVRISEEKLRAHRLLHTTSRRDGGKWIIFDLRQQPFWIASEGKQISVVLPNEEGSEVSRYWHAVNRFLDTNDDAHLHPFEGEGVYDVKDRFHRFETRPNVLRKLEAIGDLNFLEIYADVAT